MIFKKGLRTYNSNISKTTCKKWPIFWYLIALYNSTLHIYSWFIGIISLSTKITLIIFGLRTYTANKQTLFHYYSIMPFSFGYDVMP